MIGKPPAKLLKPRQPTFKRSASATRSSAAKACVTAEALYASFRPSVAKALRGFEPPLQTPSDMHRVSLDRMQFPVPELLLLLLRNVMRFPWEGQGEKVRWTVRFSVNGSPCAVELTKFGLKLYVRKGDPALYQRVSGQLGSALARLEKRLEPMIEMQMRLGNVSLANRSSDFDARYRFFRDKADVAYRSSQRKVGSKPSGDSHTPGLDISQIVADLNRTVRRSREGFFNSVAMVDAYFSYLEHRLVLLRAFTGRAVPEGGVQSILMKRWDEKFAETLGAESAAEHGALLGRLRDLKERIRNPFAHGGVENDGGSIYCHVPFVGAIPGNMSRTKRSAHFKWIPVEVEDFRSICELFDSVDSVLKSGPMEKPALLADGGVDPAWDGDQLKRYRKLLRGSRKALEAFVTHWNYERDRHDNMDY